MIPMTPDEIIFSQTAKNKLQFVGAVISADLMREIQSGY